MLKIHRIAISRPIAQRYVVMPIFEDGSAGDAKAFDTEVDAIGYANQQYPGLDTRSLWRKYPSVLQIAAPTKGKRHPLSEPRHVGDGQRRRRGDVAETGQERLHAAAGR
ncbi:hypothetical protein [Cupriavidus necator]